MKIAMQRRQSLPPLISRFSPVSNPCCEVIPVQSGLTSRPVSLGGSRTQGALILAPFAGDIGHLGCRRVARFCRWLTASGFSVCVMTSGDCAIDAPVETLSVADPLRVHCSGVSTPMAQKRSKTLARRVARRVVVPDSTIAWALMVCGSARAYRAARRASVVITTGPPEAPHLAGTWLSRLTGTPHLVDYRDGWTDEPLKREMQDSGVRRWVESFLEAAVLRHAAAVTLTSEEWSHAVSSRHPEMARRLHVLTNCVPAGLRPNASLSHNPRMRRLVYAGRLSGSHFSRRPDPLLEYLQTEAQLLGSALEVVFIGDLAAEEVARIQAFADRVSGFGWFVRQLGNLPYERVLEELSRSDGFLLLSASQHALPSKLFDYLGLGRPILCMADPMSAAWRVCSRLPQAWMVDIAAPTSRPGFCRSVESAESTSVPFEFTEDAVRERFLEIVREVAKSRPFQGSRDQSLP